MSLLKLPECFVTLAHLVMQHTLKGTSPYNPYLSGRSKKRGVKKKMNFLRRGPKRIFGILVEGAIALPVTPGGGVLFAS